jgi:transcriptional regulator with XRE-family HTH domain
MFLQKKYLTGNLNYMANNLGEWIKKGLSDLGKNQAWLAIQVGLQPPQISRIISGESEAMPDVLNKIADALHKPRIQAYRAAGHFGDATEEEEWVETMNHKIKLVPTTQRSVAEKLLDALIEEPQPGAKLKKSKA